MKNNIIIDIHTSGVIISARKQMRRSVNLFIRGVESLSQTGGAINRKISLLPLWLVIFAFVLQPLPIVMDVAQAKVQTKNLNTAALKLLNEQGQYKEVPSKRTRYASYYETPSGKGYLVQTQHSQNYQDAAGTWQKIDTALVKKDVASSLFQTQAAQPTQGRSTTETVQALSNSTNRFASTFNPGIDGPVLVFQEGNQTLKISLKDAKLASPKSEGNSLTYADIFPGVDLRYTTDSDGLKEEIIINRPSPTTSLNYQVSLSDGLTISQDGGGAKILDQSGKALWYLAQPSMINRASGDPLYAKYQIQSRDRNGIIGLTIPEFNKLFNLSEESYPITLDPSIVVPSDSDSTAVYSWDPDTNYRAQNPLQLGMTTLGVARDYLKFPNLNIPGGTNIDSAIFAITLQEERPVVPRVKLYRATSDWYEGQGGVSWNNQPSIDPTAVSSTAQAVSYAWWNFDVTSLVKGWSNGSLPNYGFSLRYHDESIQRKNFISRYEASAPLYKPQIVVFYNQTKQNELGQASWWQYVSQAAGGGTLNANVANGNLVYSFSDFSLDGRGFDTQLSHYYNNQESYDGPFGNNWTITANKRLVISGDRRLVQFIDGTGNRFTFSDSEGDGNYVDKDVSGDKDFYFDSSSGFYNRPDRRPNGLTMGLRYDAGQNRFIALSTDKKTVTFDGQGRLLEERDRNNNTLTYGYSGNLLTNITDASGRQVVLKYNLDNRLLEITDFNYNDPAYRTTGGRITYEYEGNNLKKVSYFTDTTLNETNSFGYNSSGLNTITDGLGNVTQVNYDTANRVKEMVDPLGKMATLSYPAVGQTRVVSPKGNEAGANPNTYATDYFYRSGSFLTGLVYKSIGPEVKDAAGAMIRQTTEYDYTDDFAVAATTDHAGAVQSAAYDDISGNLRYQNDELGAITNLVTYTPSNYSTGDWRLLESYNSNGVQTVYQYDQSGNMERKSIMDGTEINHLLNPGFEGYSGTRTQTEYEVYCNYNFRRVGVADYWCGSGGLPREVRYYDVDQGTSASGRKSQKLTISGNASAGSINFFQGTNEIPRLMPDTDYVLSYKYKTQDDGGPAVVEPAMLHYDTGTNPNENTIGSTVIGPATPLSSSWRDATWAFHTPLNNPANGKGYWSSEIFLRFKATVPGVTYSVWFDDVRLERGSVPSGNNVEKATNLVYYPNGLVQTETNPEGKTTSYVWDDNGNLLSVTDPLQNVSTYSYDPNGNRLKKTEPKGTASAGNANDYTTLFSYDGQNRLKTVKDPVLNTTTSYKYDLAGNLLSTTGPTGLTSTYKYDKANRLKETVNPYGYTSAVQYDANGNPKSIIDPNSNQSASNYDAGDRLAAETDPNGKQTTYAYDATDNVKNIQEGAASLNYNYDKSGQLLSETNNATGENKTINYTYDKEGNVTVVNSQTGETTDVRYLNTNEITKVTVGGLTTAYTRNRNNQLVALDKPNGDQLKIAYNDGAQVTALSNERGGQIVTKISYNYDSNGNRTRKVVENTGVDEVSYGYTYDNLNQLISSRNESTEEVTQYSYDKAGNLLSVRRPDGQFELLSYKGNRLVRKSVSGQSERYNYDANGNLTSRDMGDNIDALLHFNTDLVNARGKSSIKLEGATTPAYSAGKLNQAVDLGASQYLSINSAGNFEKGNNTIEFWFKPNWSNDNQVHTLFDYTITDKYEYRLTKLADGRLELHFVSLGKDRSFNSAPLDWQANQWYQIAVGVNNNKAYLMRDGSVLAEKSYCAQLMVCIEPVQATLLNAQNLYLGAKLGIGTVATEFALGSFDELRISSGLRSQADITAAFATPAESTLAKTTTYQYDSSDYLTSITKPSGEVITYTYDSNKRVVKRAMTGQEDVNYQYDGDKINSELKNDKTVIAKYFYDANGSLLYIAKGGQNYYPVLDGLGSITALRDQSGTTVATYQYDEWGKLLGKTGTVDTPLRYASYWYDTDAGLYHLGARWYDPTLYRFISVDPHPGDQDDPATLNGYVYVRNNPLNYTDPDGNYALAAGALIGGSAYGASTAALAALFPWVVGAAVVIGGSAVIYRAIKNRPKKPCTTPPSFYNRMFRDMTDSQLEKGIRGHEKQIEIHLDKIRKGRGKVPSYVTKTWEKHITKAQNEIKKKRVELEKRRVGRQKYDKCMGGR